MSIASPGSRAERLPDDRALGRLVARLASVNNSVGVIRLVERWAQHRTPTRAALLVESRAFIDLRLMDRAWVRLREVTEQDPSDLEAVALTAEMFIARGWPARAERLVERLQTLGLDGARLAAIEAGVRAPAARPPSNARELEKSGALPQQVALAEAFLASGSVLRARGLLDRLSRNHPGQARVLQLQWGLRGDFAAGQQSLSALITELQTGFTGDGGGWSAAEPTATFDGGGDETAEVSKVMRTAPGASSGLGAAFSSLFRMDSDELHEDDEDDDVTVAAVMASTEELLDPPTADHSDPDGVIDSGAGDTQIMQVIGQGDNRRLTPVTGPVHQRRSGGSGPVDLRRWRADHGIVPSTAMLDAPTIDGLSGLGEEGFLEDEDEDVVVMKNQGAPADAPRTPSPRRSPISVIERVPSPPPPVPGLPAQDEDTPTVGPAPAFEKKVPPPASTSLGEATLPLRTPSVTPPDALPRSSSNVGRLIAVTAALVAVVASVAVVVGIRSYTGLRQSAAVRDAVLDSHPSQLIEVRKELREVLRNDGLLSPRPSNVAARLALIDVAIWQHVSGAPEALAEAHQLAAEGIGGPEAQLAVAWIDHAGGVPFDRRTIGDSPLAQLLIAEAALAEGDTSSAEKALRDLVGDDGVRVSLAKAQLAQDTGNGDTAKLTSEALAHPLGLLWRVQGGDATLSEKHRLASLQALRESLPDGAGRLMARSWVVEAGVHAEAGRAEAAAAAWEEALRSDPSDPVLLAHLAASRRTPAGSIKLLRQCLKLLASSPDCQRGIVQVLVEEGDLRRATALVDSWREAGLGVGLLADWVSLEGAPASVRPRAPDDRDPHRAGRGLSRYLDALSQSGKAARRSGLEAAHAQLTQSDDLWDQRLGTHIEKVHFDPSP